MFLSKLPERKHIIHVFIMPLKYSKEILEILKKNLFTVDHVRSNYVN